MPVGWWVSECPGIVPNYSVTEINNFFALPVYLSSSIWNMIKGKVVAGIWVPAMLISVYSVVLAQLVSDSGSRQGWMFHSSLRSTLLTT